MKNKHFYTAVILLLLLAVGIQPTFATKYIPSDTEIGTWDGTERIYTLTTNNTITETLFIEVDNLTLDGNGKTVELNSQGLFDYGVDLGGNPYPGPYRVNVTIQNLNVTACGVGINLLGCQYTTIQNVNVTGCNTGIGLNPSGSCNVLNSTISDCLMYGIFMQSAGTNTIEGNVISNNDTGIILQDGSVYNTLKNNTIEENNVGLHIPATGSVHDNTIYNNNFINNSQQATVYNNYNLFYLSKEEGGGNYWSNYTGADNDGDGFGDIHYVVSETYQVEDYFPLMPTPQTKIVELIDTVEVMNLHQGIDNSLDAKLDAAFKALDDVNQNNDVAAINTLNAFINAVEDQRGDKITDEQADTLVADANYIITLLGG